MTRVYLPRLLLMCVSSEGGRLTDSSSGSIPECPWLCADDMAALEASCSLVPVQDNPYCSHTLPLQAAQQLERERRPAAAALAYEAAARVSAPCAAIFVRLCALR